jgi:magnesium chelatase family protein
MFCGALIELWVAFTGRQSPQSRPKYTGPMAESAGVHTAHKVHDGGARPGSRHAHTGCLNSNPGGLFAMSLAVVYSRALLGLQAPEVRVEVHVANGLPAFHIVGLPEAAVRESRERVRAAILQSGLDFPHRRLTVNLAPADLPKDSGRFDLPIAVGVLVAAGQLPGDSLAELELVGELSLTGDLRPIRGALAMALAVRHRGRRLVLPAGSSAEAALDADVNALAASHLSDVCAHLRGESTLVRVEHQSPTMAGPIAYTDFADVHAHEEARRALEVAAAGAHSVLMVGPPGAGKSMLASRLPSILPGPLADESLEIASIQALAGRFEASHWGQRPFRSPHHTASTAALVGGGGNPRPGEISLAHCGVLFLDELAEFKRSALEALREPLETGRITVSRACGRIDFPARFQLVAAMNPCPCGQAPSARCRCSHDQVSRYQQRISGPVLDRVDIHVRVDPIDERRLLAADRAEPSALIQSRVQSAWDRQLRRQAMPNAHLQAADIERFCPLTDSARDLLARAAARLRWSARAVHRALRVARSLADLDACDQLADEHVAHAISLRRALLHTPPPD